MARLPTILCSVHNGENPLSFICTGIYMYRVGLRRVSGSVSQFAEYHVSSPPQDNIYPERHEGTQFSIPRAAASYSTNNQAHISKDHGVIACERHARLVARLDTNRRHTVCHAIRKKLTLHRLGKSRFESS